MRTQRLMFFFCIKNYIRTQGEVCTVKGFKPRCSVYRPTSGPGVVLILCRSIVYITRRFIIGLALLFVYVFLLSFQHFCHLAWGRGSCSLCASCMCLLAMHTLICVTFSLPPGVRGWLRLLLVVLPGLFCVHFSNT